VGPNLAEVIAPEQGSRSSPLGDLLLLLAVVIFLEHGWWWAYLPRRWPAATQAVPLAAPWPGPASLHAASFLVIAASAKLIEAAIGLRGSLSWFLFSWPTWLSVPWAARCRRSHSIRGHAGQGPAGRGPMLAGLATLDSALTAGFRGFLALLERAAQLGR